MKRLARVEGREGKGHQKASKTTEKMATQRPGENTKEFPAFFAGNPEVPVTVPSCFTVGNFVPEKYSFEDGYVMLGVPEAGGQLGTG